ncbi:TIGR03936 family radical SAM-associated protein [Tautonia marina]|uniref:TIGR03936 family radical SAM-associated protein n=1 Tax=Tautonia marina TaxID=2653855 RepID=UPI001260667F|nr:TIGR03936 family radical SAM-associated protein [Tautonia marina]
MDDATSRLRIRFAKRGDLRLVSHHDLMRCLERVLRRAALPVAHSQGFNPRPKLSFPLALALGIEGRREVLELELAEPLRPSEVLRRLCDVAPPGLDFLEAIPAPGRSGRVAFVEYLFPLPDERRGPTVDAVAALLDRQTCPYVRRKPGRDVPLDLRSSVLDARVDPADGALRLRLKIDAGVSARPEEVLDVLGLRDLMAAGTVLSRTEVVLTTESPVTSTVPDHSGSPPSPPAPRDTTDPKPSVSRSGQSP